MKYIRCPYFLRSKLRKHINHGFKNGINICDLLINYASIQCVNLFTPHHEYIYCLSMSCVMPILNTVICLQSVFDVPTVRILLSILN
jgi:hypothetical protein